MPHAVANLSAAGVSDSGANPPAPARAAHSYDEFSQLREVVVGTVRGARTPSQTDLSSWLNLYGDLPEDRLADIATGPFHPQVIEETDEDLDALVSVLRSCGVIVHRPEYVDHGAEFASPHWRTEGFYSYCPRDLALIIGDTIIETPSPMRARYFELFGLRELFQTYLLNGSSWISAPKPQLRDELYRVDNSGPPRLGELEPAFEAANVLRCGRDLFYQVSASGNELGLVWLETVLRNHGEFTIHPLRGIYEYTHIDSTIALLRPGLALLNPSRINEDNLPAALRRWDIIWCPPMEPTGPVSGAPLSSEWIGMNLLMINEGQAVVDAAQVALIKELKAHRIDVIPLFLRHSRTLGGGFHCVTLDTVRDGELVDYLR